MCFTPDADLGRLQVLQQPNVMLEEARILPRVDGYNGDNEGYTANMQECSSAYNLKAVMHPKVCRI